MRAALALPVLLLATAASSDTPAPDTSGIVHVVGRYALAQACPISPERALTNAHVLDPRPYDRDFPLQPYLWSDDAGNGGILIPEYVQLERDLGAARGSFPRVYPRAQAAPSPGEYLWFVGYRYDGKHTMETETIRAKVLRVVARHVIYTPGGHPGSSGSCVLNAAGEVVAINAGMFNDSDAGIGVAVWQSAWAPEEVKQ